MVFHIRCHICGERKWAMPILPTSGKHVWKNLSQASSLSLKKHTLVRLQARCETEFWTMKTNFLLERQSDFKQMVCEQPRFCPGFLTYILFESCNCHKDKDTTNLMSSIRAEERGSGLGLIHGKQEKEREKLAEVELPEKYLETPSLEEIWCSSFLCIW